MANVDTKLERGFVDKRNTQGRTANQHTGTFTSNTKDVSAMRARLAAISSTTYTSTVLDKMTENDMLYAIRMNDEAGSI